MAMHSTLKSVTAPAHQTLEKRIIGYLRKIQSKEDYAQLLISYYGFIKPVEDKLRSYIHADFLPDIDKRMRVHWLATDLIQLRVATDSSIQYCFNTGYINSLAAALGALYVLEGSTLGGKHIVQMLNQKSIAENVTTYFAGYGEENPYMWETFKNILDQDYHSSFQEQVISSANLTFRFFDEWLLQKLPVYHA